MFRYLLLRLTWIIFVVLGVVTLTFFISRVIPADPARLAAGLNAGPEQVAEVKRSLGLDQPVYVQYQRYMAGLLQFDLGRSIQTRQPVWDDIKLAFPATLELVIFSFTIYVILGLGIGVVWAVWPDSVAALLARVVSAIGAAVPIFWIGLVFQLVFGTQLGWLPIAGRLDLAALPPPHVTGFYTIDTLLAGDTALFRDALLHLFLPVASLVLSLLALAARLTQAAVREELKKGYVRTARSKGLSEGAVLRSHVLKNALNPVLTMLGLQFGWLLGGTILVEAVFSWPGIGLYAFESFKTFDYAPIQALTLLITFVFVFVNLLVDLTYPVLDPRLRQST
ncbi:MAG: peptide ABC transporter permease [Chloroflexota bacterium]|nr:MAG: peptide ABC transporter permease [Chloroflexota bacterium]